MGADVDSETIDPLIEELRAAILESKELRGARVSLTDAEEIVQNQRARAAADAKRDGLLSQVPRNKSYSDTGLTAVIAKNAADADTLDQLAALCGVQNDAKFRRRCSHMTEGGRELEQFKHRFFVPGAQKHR